MKVIEKAQRNFGCPYCNNRKLLKGYNDLQTKFPHLAKEWSSKNKTFPEDCLPCSKERLIS